MSAPLNTPGTGPELLNPREAVISNTRNALSNLAQQTFPLAMGLGTLGVMAYGLKKMFKPLMNN